MFERGRGNGIGNGTGDPLSGRSVRAGAADRRMAEENGGSAEFSFTTGDGNGADLCCEFSSRRGGDRGACGVQSFQPAVRRDSGSPRSGDALRNRGVQAAVTQ